jgi:hypothetical protein
MSSLLAGYGGHVAPPFSRTYIGGAQDIRGFEIRGISPVSYIPSTAQTPILNADGSARYQKSANGTVTQAMLTIPYYQLVFPGGDTQIVTNFEYRIPIVGPVTLAPFIDFGINKIALPGQLRMKPGRVAERNSTFPQAGFNERALMAPGTQSARMSTGLELQVLLPVVMRHSGSTGLTTPCWCGRICSPHCRGPVVLPQQRHVSEFDCHLRGRYSILREALDFQVHHRPYVLSILVSKDMRSLIA